MRTNVVMFWILSGFFLAIAAVYAVWTLVVDHTGQPEWVGTIGMALCAVLAVVIGFYLGRVRVSQGGELPEDRLDAEIDDGDPEIGHFSPWSWWPILLAGAAALAMLGLSAATWLVFIAAPLALIFLVGWVYEYYRGNFAR